MRYFGYEYIHKKQNNGPDVFSNRCIQAKICLSVALELDECGKKWEESLKKYAEQGELFVCIKMFPESLGYFKSL